MSSKLNFFRKKKSSLGRRHTVSGDHNETIEQAKNDMEIDTNISARAGNHVPDGLMENNKFLAINSAEVNGSKPAKSIRSLKQEVKNKTKFSLSSKSFRIADSNIDSAISSHMDTQQQAITEPQTDSTLSKLFISRNRNKPIRQRKPTKQNHEDILIKKLPIIILQYNGEIMKMVVPEEASLSWLRRVFADEFQIEQLPLCDPTSLKFTVKHEGSKNAKRLEGAFDIIDGAAITLDYIEAATTQLSADSRRQSHTSHQSNTSQTPRGSQNDLNQDSVVTIKNINNELKLANEIADLKGLVKSALRNTPPQLPMGSHFVNPVSQSPFNPTIFIPAPPPQTLTNCIQDFAAQVRLVKKDLESMKTVFKEQRQDFREFFHHASMNLVDRIRVDQSLNKMLVSDGMPVLRRERLELIKPEELYIERSTEAFKEIKLLETAVEEIRVDVSQRNCKVVKAEVEQLSKSVSEAGIVMVNLMKTYTNLQPALQKVMEGELEVIVKEEEIMKKEGEKLEDAIHKCSHLNNTLNTLTEFANVQTSRGLRVTLLSVVDVNSKQILKESLMQEIRNQKISHESRVESIELAEKIKQRKLLAFEDPVKKFTKELGTQKQILLKTHNLENITRRDSKLLSLFCNDYREEKIKRQQIIPKQPKAYNQTLIANSAPQAFPFSKPRYNMEAQQFQNYNRSISDNDQRMREIHAFSRLEFQDNFQPHYPSNPSSNVTQRRSHPDIPSYGKQQPNPNYPQSNQSISSYLSSAPSSLLEVPYNQHVNTGQGQFSFVQTNPSYLQNYPTHKYPGMAQNNMTHMYFNNNNNNNNNISNSLNTNSISHFYNNNYNNNNNNNNSYVYPRNAQSYPSNINSVIQRSNLIQPQRTAPLPPFQAQRVNSDPKIGISRSNTITAKNINMKEDIAGPLAGRTRKLAPVPAPPKTPQQKSKYYTRNIDSCSDDSVNLWPGRQPQNLSVV